MSVTELRRRLSLTRELPPPDVRRRLREGAGVSLAEIGRACGVTSSAVAFWERGERTPTGENLRRYVRVLNLLREATKEAVT
jgi:transcriptional regulator with XRE-family HTH domain